MNVIATVLCMILLNASLPTAHGWKGITPLRSSRGDVERLLGPSLGRCRCDYKTDTENVFIVYSGDPCEDGNPKAWNVPRDTVLELTIYPKEEPELSILNLDLRRFKKTRDPELQGYTRYSSASAGVTYAVDASGLVYSISHYPLPKDECLRCQVKPVK